MTDSSTTERRLIFSANPGRSGSSYVAKLLNRSDSIDAGHERIPTMTGPWLRDVAYQGPAHSFAKRRIKADSIVDDLRQLDEGVAYADTSHMFVKTFGDVVYEAFPESQVTVLEIRRDPLLVAKSYFELGLLGPNAGTWHDWMIAPTAPAAVFRLDPARVADQFDLIFGSLVDNHLRAEQLRAAHPNSRWIDVELAAVSTTPGAVALFEALGVDLPDDLDAVIGTIENTKPVEKARTGLGCSEDFVRSGWAGFRSRFGHRVEVDAFAAHYWPEGLR